MRIRDIDSGDKERSERQKNECFYHLVVSVCDYGLKVFGSRETSPLNCNGAIVVKEDFNTRSYLESTGGIIRTRMRTDVGCYRTQSSG